MSTRKIMVGGEAYRYWVGPSYTKIQTPRATVRYIPNHVLAEVTAMEWERGREKGTASITPKMVATAIRGF